MTQIRCAGVIEMLVEGARHGLEPDQPARGHLLVCAECADRWEAETALAGQFQAMRAEFGGRRSAFIRRTEMLRRFDARYPQRTLRPWWGLAAAAAVLFSVGLGITLHDRGMNTAALPGEEISEAQAEIQEAGFIAVPFVPPLAPGELVHMVHTQLQPATLASMGVNVDPTLSADLPADVLVGADGFPRAVRISEEAVGQGGY